MTSSAQNLPDGAPTLSTRTLIIRGALLLAFGCFADFAVRWIAIHSITLTGISGLDFLTLITMAQCIVFFLIGVIASYVFWPRKYWAIVVWLALFFLLLHGPYLNLNYLGALFHKGNIQHVLLAPLALAGYTAPRIFFRNLESQTNFRRRLVGLVTLVGIVFAVGFLTEKTLFYTSGGYSKAMALEIPTPEDAQDVRGTKNRRWGMNSLFFKSTPSENRKIFEFYDAAFAREGFVRFRAPTFESMERSNIFLVAGRITITSSAEAEYVRSMLQAAWVDEQKDVLIFMKAYSREKPISENALGYDSDEMDVFVFARPFIPQDEHLTGDRLLPNTPDLDLEIPGA